MTLRSARGTGAEDRRDLLAGVEPRPANCTIFPATEYCRSAPQLSHQEALLLRHKGRAADPLPNACSRLISKAFSSPFDGVVRRRMAKSALRRGRRLRAPPRTRLARSGRRSAFRRSDPNLWEMVMTRGLGGHSPENVSHHLKGIDFPASKQDLMRQARDARRPTPGRTPCSLRSHAHIQAQNLRIRLAAWPWRLYVSLLVVSRRGLNGRPRALQRAGGHCVRLPVFPPSNDPVRAFIGLEGLRAGRRPGNGKASNGSLRAHLHGASGRHRAAG